MELILVLPVFMLLLFFIMEIGNLAWQTILVHHCAYELARIGSLVAGPKGGCSSADECAKSDSGRAQLKMEAVLSTMSTPPYSLNPGAEVKGECVETNPASPDPQSLQKNEDLVVTLTYPAKLVFWGSSYALADEPGKGIRTITAVVRMPIEKPFFK